LHLKDILNYEINKIITGIKNAENLPNIHIFHAGTKQTDENLVTSGGRVLAITGVDLSVKAAADLAYKALHNINFDGIKFRYDIGRKKVKLAVLASTRGTDMQAIIDAIETGKLSAEIRVVISNKGDAYVLTRAKNYNIDSKVILSQGKTREEFDSEVLSIINSHGGVDLILLIGFMRIISPVLIDQYPNRIINVHPSLLPAFAGGMDTMVHKKVLESGCKVSGCTIHIVDYGVDTGPIILQKQCEIIPGETEDSLKEKVQKLEGEAFIEVINKFQVNRSLII